MVSYPAKEDAVMYQRRYQRAVVCHETGKFFPTPRRAENEMGLTIGQVNKFVLGSRRHPVGGYTFSFLTIHYGLNRRR